MEQLLISPYWLALLFFVVSLAYSSVGLGGGTSYTALLGAVGAGQRAIPTVSLTMNVVVSVMVTVNYLRAGHARWSLIGAILLASAPMAYVGGGLPVDEGIFYPLLIAVLLLAAGRMLWWSEPRLRVEWDWKWRLGAAVSLGAGIGFFSGLVGIGGGIFLVPALVVLGVADEKEAACAGGIFILVNSVAGLGAHLQYYRPAVGEVAPLVAAVLAGSFSGSYLGALRLRRRTIRRVMGLIIVAAVVLLSLRVWG